MSHSHEAPPANGTGFFAWWSRTPLYLRILAGLILGVVVGMAFGAQAAPLAIPSKLILRLLGALAPMIILVAVIRALMTAEFRGRVAGRLAFLLVLNTIVAITVGLLVANVVQPGRHARLEPKRVVPASELEQDPDRRAILQTLEQYGYTPSGGKTDPVAAFLDNVPDSLLRPLVDTTKVIGVIFVAVAFGIALRRERRTELRTVEDFVDLGFRSLLTLLHWIIELVPLGVFGIVASIVGEKGFQAFFGLGAFIGAVLLALFLQAVYYLTRVRLASWVRPTDLLRGGRDALVMAFSTASSTATMPLTFESLRKRVGIREESASMGALVGANFNNDGTALYEAMSALFISQMIGQHLDLSQQLIVVLTSVIASVGAAGIPEAGLVTMTMVFKAVHLPTEYIALLLTVDWFLDRCRTAINVMGDMNVSCILDGRKREDPADDPAPAVADAGVVG